MPRRALIRLIGAVLLLAVQAAGPALQPARTIQAQSGTTIQAAPGRWIVLLKPAIGVTSAGVAAGYDARPGVAVDHVYMSAINGFAGTIDQAAARDLADDPRVAGVFPDIISQAASQSLPPGINRVDADLNPTKAGSGSGSVDADIAVLDSGVADLSDLNLAGGTDCTNSGGFADDNGHGTHVAGIAAARDNDQGVVGVAPGANLGGQGLAWEQPRLRVGDHLRVGLGGYPFRSDRRRQHEHPGLLRQHRKRLRRAPVPPGGLHRGQPGCHRRGGGRKR